MSLSKETLQRITRELWSTEAPPGEIEETLVWLTPALEGLAELDALDLEGLEPAVTFAAAPLDATAAPGVGEGT